MLSYGFIQFTQGYSVLFCFQDFAFCIGASDILYPDIDGVKGIHQPAEYVAFANLQNNSRSVSTLNSKPFAAQ